MSLWKQSASVEELNRMQSGSIASYLGIEFVDIGSPLVNHVVLGSQIAAECVDPRRNR